MVSAGSVGAAVSSGSVAGIGSVGAAVSAGDWTISCADAPKVKDSSRAIRRMLASADL